MTAAVSWFLQRQYLTNKGRHSCSPSLNGFVENFTCSSNDDYGIEGEMGMPLPPFVAKFSKHLLNGHMLGVADEDGHVKLLDTHKHKKDSMIKEWSAHSNAVFDLAWIDNEPKLITASGDQTARLWDIEKSETIAIFRGHTCSLKSVSVQPQSNKVFVSGARDGNILLWDTRCYMQNGFCNPMNTINNAHVLPQKEVLTSSGKKRKQRRPSLHASVPKQSVTSVIFQDNYTIISAGACDGAIKFWDIRRNYKNVKSNSSSFHVIHYPDKGPRKHGYSSLVLNSTNSRLFAVCTNDVIYEYPISNLPLSPLQTYRGHHTSSFYVKAALSPDDRFLLCGSGDNNAYIWNTADSCSPPWLLKGHESEVTSVAWSPNDGEKIVTCSDDNMFKIWRLFQPDNEIVTGKCERKEMQPDRPEHVLAPSYPHPVCKPLDLCTNRRITMKWNSTQHSKKKKTNSSTSGYTNLTPKSMCASPPSPPPRPNHQHLLTPLVKTNARASCKTNASPATPKSAQLLTPVTPKSSQLFMQTWLKSPAITPKIIPKMKTEEVTTNSTDSLPSSNKNTSTKINTQTDVVISDNKIKHNSEKKTFQLNENNNTKTKNSRKSLPRKKLSANINSREIMKDTENIRTLFNRYNKRVRKVTAENDLKAAKSLKLDKENDLFISSEKKKEDDLIFVSRKADVIMDLLDHAEDSSKSS